MKTETKVMYTKEVSKLTEDEAGKLHGGFSVNDAKIAIDFFATNVNCVGGGWGDTNTNCTGTCGSCSSTVVVQQPTL